MTVEEHNALHRVSEETRERISKATSIAKLKYTKDEIKEHKAMADRLYRKNNHLKICEYKRIIEN